MAITDIKAKQAKPKEKTYKISDEKGLYLEVTPTGGKYWRLKYRFAGKEKRLALGVYPEVSLSEARDLMADARKLLKNGVDPAAAKKAAKQKTSEDAANCFKVIAIEWYEKEKPHWSKSHADRVWRFLNQGLFPYIGNAPINELDAPTILGALRRIESRGAIETAHRTKQAAAQVFRYAIATGRAKANPVPDLQGALKTPEEKHLAAITDPKEVGQLMLAIEGFSGTATVKAALMISPLLFQRPGEIRQMEWAHINWEKAQWERPLSKQDNKKKAALAALGITSHIVPLSSQALAILEEQKLLTGNGRYVFPGARGASRPLSENAVRVALRTLGYTNEQMTPHGFRAMARTLMDEELGIRIEYIEHQLAHAVKDVLGRAYNRTKHLEQRKAMMQQWADYLDALKEQARNGNVIAGNFKKVKEKA